MVALLNNEGKRPGIFRRISKSIRGGSTGADKAQNTAPASPEGFGANRKKRAPLQDTTNKKLPIAEAFQRAPEDSPFYSTLKRTDTLRQKLMRPGQVDEPSYHPQPPMSPDLNAAVEPAPGAPNRTVDTSAPLSTPGVSLAPRADMPQENGSVNEDVIQDWQPLPRVQPSRSISRSRRRHAPEETGIRESTYIDGSTLERANVARQKSLRREAVVTAAPKAGGPTAPNGASLAAAPPMVSNPTFDTPTPLSSDENIVLADSARVGRTPSLARAASRVRKHVEQRLATTTLRRDLSEDIEGRVLILIADGSEEIDTFTALDILTRANLHPTIASISPEFSPSASLPYISLSRGGKVLADAQFARMRAEHKADFDAIVIPGGAKGAERLSQDPTVNALVQQFFAGQKLVALSSAGAVLALSAGIGLGCKLTSNDNVRTYLEPYYAYDPGRVVLDENLLTSRGPASALEWSLSIVEALAGKRIRDKVEAKL